MAEIDSITSADNGATSLAALKTDIDALYASITALGDVVWVDGAGYITPPNTTSVMIYDVGKVTIERNDLDDTVSKYGLTAVLKKTSGVNNVCSLYAETYSMGADCTAFGLAVVAGTGDQDEEPTSSSILVGGEFKVFSQYHANDNILAGITIPFATRSGEGNPVLHGGVGDNAFNENSRAIQISSQARSSVGEYCGWNKGIVFYDKLDRTATTAYTTLIDFQATTYDKENNNPWIFLWKQQSVVFGMRYNTTNQYIEFYRDVTGTPSRMGYINMNGTDHAL